MIILYIIGYLVIGAIAAALFADEDRVEGAFLVALWPILGLLYILSRPFVFIAGVALWIREEIKRH